MTTDPVIAALNDLIDALYENIAASRDVIERARRIVELRESGLSFRAIADQTGRPRVVEVITENMQRLHTYGARLRRAQASALHNEGMTMEQIAELFGVTRQRISAILREADHGSREEAS